MSDDWDTYNRNWNGAINAPGLPDPIAQYKAGVGPLDDYVTASLKVEEQERYEKHCRNGTLGAYLCPSVGPTSASSSGGGFFATLGYLFLGLMALGVLGAGGWAYENRASLARGAEAWAIKAAFRDEGFAPFEAYGEFVPRKARLADPSTKKFIRDLERTMSRSMSDPRRRALGASAWKCVSERSDCLREATAATPGGATITIAVAEKFLEHARSKGSVEAVADLGMTKIRFDHPLRARGLAQAEWEKGIEKAPGAARAKALLAKSKDFWAFRLFDSVAKLAATAGAALSGL